MAENEAIEETRSARALVAPSFTCAQAGNSAERQSVKRSTVMFNRNAQLVVASSERTLK